MKPLMKLLRRVSCMVWAVVAGAAVFPMSHGCGFSTAYGPGPPADPKECSVQPTSIASVVATPNPLSLGQDVTILVTLPLPTGASPKFIVRMTKPDGSNTSDIVLPAKDDGTADDAQAGDGIFTYVWRATDSSYPFTASGHYTIRVLAQLTLSSGGSYFQCGTLTDVAVTDLAVSP